MCMRKGISDNHDDMAVNAMETCSGMDNGTGAFGKDGGCRIWGQATGRYTRYVVILMAVSAVVRVLCAALIEFGNDEVYYRLYALFPDWSHFDHPGMVGWMIQIFTFNLALDSELAIRMASIVLGTVNIWLMYIIGAEVGGDRRTGWYSALLYVSSLYATVICGTFIMPDTPQATFWLAALLCFLRAFGDGRRSGSWMLAAGLACGLAFLSKYTSAFLWTGAGLYIVFHDRRWLRRWELYAAIVVTAVCMLPVLVWNMQNDFISFTFHSERVVSQHQLHPEYFGREIAGEFFYNNFDPDFLGGVVAEGDSSALVRSGLCDTCPPGGLSSSTDGQAYLEGWHYEPLGDGSRGIYSSAAASGLGGDTDRCHPFGPSYGVQQDGQG